MKITVRARRRPCANFRRSAHPIAAPASGNSCEHIWCYTLNLQRQETVGGKITWMPGPDFKGCNYIDLDLHPTPGSNGVRVDAVPAYSEHELMAKGLISSKPAG